MIPTTSLTFLVVCGLLPSWTLSSFASQRHYDQPRRALLTRHSRTPASTWLNAGSSSLTEDPTLISRDSLFSFASQAEIDERWERIDDVIMGGVSSSRLSFEVQEGEGDSQSETQGYANFQGRIREAGGGFCGQRLKLLADPLDLSASDGIYVDCEADELAECRVWKLALRTKQDRGEVVYQAITSPAPSKRQTLYVPFEDFQLVRGARLVSGAPPLSASATNQTYQLSVIVSKFLISDQMKALTNFKEGPFSMKVFEIGSFKKHELDDVPQDLPVQQVALPRSLSKEEQKRSKPIPLRVMGPILSLLFGESRRRRKVADSLLMARGYGFLGRARFGWRTRRAGGRCALPRALAKSLSILVQDVLAFCLSVPVRLLFKAIFGVAKTVQKKRGMPGA